jgi:hypothetical protein
MIRKLLATLAVAGLLGLPLTIGCEDEVKQIDEKHETRSGPVQDVSPGETVVTPDR